MELLQDKGAETVVSPLQWIDFEDGQTLDKRLCTRDVSGYRIRKFGEKWEAHFITPQITFQYSTPKYDSLDDAKAACQRHAETGKWDA